MENAQTNKLNPYLLNLSNFYLGKYRVEQNNMRKQKEEQHKYCHHLFSSLTLSASYACMFCFFIRVRPYPLKQVWSIGISSPIVNQKGMK